ncbi:MAG: chromate transporter [Bariatricus sp.]
METENRNNWKTGILLFGFFFKIGCFTFGGGWSILAQMEQEFVDKRKWITKEELLDLVAVGKSVPGIMITNISMLFGYQMGGWFGGICAVLGIACPAVLILSLVTYGYTFLKSNYWCHLAMKGIRSAVVPIIGCAALSLGKEIFRTRKGQIVCGIAFLLCLFTDISNILLVLMGILAAFAVMLIKKASGNATDVTGGKEEGEKEHGVS